MEQFPTQNNRSETGGLESLFAKQVALARTLVERINRRNDLIRNQGGFDTFAEGGQYSQRDRDIYNMLEDNVTEARDAFDLGVPDKETFVLELRGLGDQDLADNIFSMFIQKPSEPVQEKGFYLVSLRRKNRKKNFLTFCYFVLSAGIEPASWVPQTHILSIERRERFVFRYYNKTSVLPTATT